VFLKAAGLCLGLGQAGGGPDPETRSVFDQLVKQTRAEFFERAKDVSSLHILLELLRPTGILVDSVMEMIENGEAYAALHRDEQLAKTYGVLGSPTYVFNEGRQLLYGNVGYRIIASNLRELMSSHPVEGEPSWC
jgi:predicted DsbA family dithiol-disulfide isomerase